MHTAKRTQKVAHGCPQAFNRVNMDFANPITVIISCPFILGVAYGTVRTFQTVVTLPFISITVGLMLGESMDVFT